MEKRAQEGPGRLTPLEAWHNALASRIPQPDELVMFDIAAQAAATVESTL